MIENPQLKAVSAIDGRYQNKIGDYADITSEFGLIKFRVRVECEWLVHLSETAAIAELPQLSSDDKAFVLQIAEQFSAEDAETVKSTEAVTNHDVKAVEYFVKEKLSERPALNAYREWVHFACTSEDINNTAYALMLKSALHDVAIPQMMRIISEIDGLAIEHADLPMLSRTHGQTASPTTLGKELKNVAARLNRQVTQLKGIEILGKFNGAVGNFNAHISAYPDADWQHISESFLARLDLTYNPWTTQIEPHDYIAELFHTCIRFNQVLLDFDRDMWSYISIDYFKQRKVEGETGSSTMPHKVNPIDFENSEGNLGVANALLDHLAQKLQISRWQRDLSDSTALRNIGSALGHCSIAYLATLKGLSRLDVNHAKIAEDLDASWEVLAEPVQTVMRKYGLDEPYERLKAATRGQQMDEALFNEILEKLDLPEQARNELAGLTPAKYIGIAAELARKPLS